MSKSVDLDALERANLSLQAFISKADFTHESWYDEEGVETMRLVEVAMVGDDWGADLLRIAETYSALLAELRAYRALLLGTKGDPKNLPGMLEIGKELLRLQGEVRRYKSWYEDACRDGEKYEAALTAYEASQK